MNANSKILHFLAPTLGFVLVAAFPIGSLLRIGHIRFAMLGLLTVIFVFYFLSGGRIKKMPALLWTYILLACLLGVGFVYTRAPTYGMHKLSLVFSYYVMMGIVLYNVAVTRDQCIRFLKGMALGGGLLIVATIFEFGNPIALLGTISRFTRYALGEEGNPIFFARYLSYSIIAITWYVFYKKKAANLIWALPLVIVGLIYMVLSGSKGPILSLAIGVVVGALISRKSWAMLPFFTGIMIVAAIAIYYFLPDDFLRQRFVQDAANSSSRMPLFINLVSTVANADAIKMLFGHGTGDYGFFIHRADVRMYPHNIVLEALYENGVLGATILIVCLSLPLLRVYKALRLGLIQDGEKMTLAVLIAAYMSSLVNSQITGDLGANIFIPMFGVLIVAYVGATPVIIQSKLMASLEDIKNKPNSNKILARKRSGYIRWKG